MIVVIPSNRSIDLDHLAPLADTEVGRFRHGPWQADQRRPPRRPERQRK